MSAWIYAGLVVIAIAAYLLVSGFVKTYRRYRGTRVIICPENLNAAAVKVDALDAAKSFAIAGEKNVHLRACSRWPEMAGCDEACLTQVEGAPEACLVHTIVSAWYTGKDCHYCHRPIGKIVWHERPPAVRLADGRTLEWKEVAAEKLPETFATGDPVCWACHITESFRHDHPDMVVERIHEEGQHQTLAPSDSVY